MKKVISVFLLSLLFFTVISCSKDESSPTDIKPEEELIINDLVTSLDSTSLKNQLISIDSESIIVSKNSELGNILKQGSIIVSNLGKGICRYVETINISGNNIIATTRIARLDEIIIKGEINYEATITPSMIESIEILDKSNRLIYKTSLENITIDFGKWFIGGNSSTELEASTEFEPPKIKFNPKFDGGLINFESYIQINNETNVNIILNNNLNGGWKYEPQWARFRLGSIPTPIPFLVIIPTLKFSVGVSASISSGLNVDFSYSTGIKAGINYKAGSIVSIWEFNDDFDVELNHRSTGEIYPYFTCPKLGFYIEDILGPFIQVQFGPKYQIFESNNTWRHKLYGVVESDWGREIDILGIFKLSQAYNIFTKEYIVFDELLSSNNPPDIPSNPSPIDGATEVSTSTTLSWQCSDPDGDPITYDIYFGTSGNPPLVRSNESTTIYSPGNLIENTLYFWKIVAEDDKNEIAESEVWNFTSASFSSEIWRESFENSLDTWVLDANATHSNSGIVSTTSTDGNQSLQLYGSIGGCWGALVYHFFKAGKSFQLEIDVKNSSEQLSGCHPDRAGIGFRQGEHWSEPEQQLISFTGDGKITDFEGDFLSNFQTNQWYELKFIIVVVDEDTLDISYYINGNHTLTKECSSKVLIEDSNLELHVQEGTAWFDNIILTTTL